MCDIIWCFTVFLLFHLEKNLGFLCVVFVILKGKMRNLKLLYICVILFWCFTVFYYYFILTKKIRIFVFVFVILKGKNKKYEIIVNLCDIFWFTVFFFFSSWKILGFLCIISSWKFVFLYLLVIIWWSLFHFLIHFFVGSSTMPGSVEEAN